MCIFAGLVVVDVAVFFPCFRLHFGIILLSLLAILTNNITHCLNLCIRIRMHEILNAVADKSCSSFHVKCVFFFVLHFIDIYLLLIPFNLLDAIIVEKQIFSFALSSTQFPYTFTHAHNIQIFIRTRVCGFNFTVYIRVYLYLFLMEWI